MTPTRELKIGRHELAVFGTNIVRVLWCGDVSDEEARAAADFYLSVALERRSIWITDLSRLGRMSFRARTIISSRDAPLPPERNVDLIFAAANLRTKIVMSIITAAASFTARGRIAMSYVDNVEEGMRMALSLNEGTQLAPDGTPKR